MADLNEGEIIFNGKSSLYDLDLKMEEYPIIPSINEEYETVKVDGRDGELHINSGTYPNRVISIKFDVISSDYDYDFELVDDWLSDITDNRLFIGRLDRCFKVIKVIKGDTQKEFRTIGNIGVTFICEPYRYDPVETVKEFIIVSEGTKSNINTIFNNGHFPIKPKIDIYGNGDANLVVGSGNTLILDIDTHTLLDSEVQECYSKTINDFPILDIGNNDIYIDYAILPGLFPPGWETGSVTEIKVTYTTRYR